MDARCRYAMARKHKHVRKEVLLMSAVKHEYPMPEELVRVPVDYLEYWDRVDGLARQYAYEHTVYMRWGLEGLKELG